MLFFGMQENTENPIIIESDQSQNYTSLLFLTKIILKKYDKSLDWLFEMFKKAPLDDDYVEFLVRNNLVSSKHTELFIKNKNEDD